jgi:hypothetical protein
MLRRCHRDIHSELDFHIQVGRLGRPSIRAHLGGMFGGGRLRSQQRDFHGGPRHVAIAAEYSSRSDLRNNANDRPNQRDGNDTTP